METKIVRNDTGLDFKRIERIIEIFQAKANKQLELVRREKSTEIKRREKEAFEHFGLQDHIREIEGIDQRIDALKNERKKHEEKVRDFTQGKSERYNSYDSIRDGSPIHQYVHQNDDGYSEKEKAFRGLIERISEEIWFAKDIGQAADIYERYISLLEQMI